MTRPRVVYVVSTAGLCGGVKVLFRHAAGLRARGWDAEVWAVGGYSGWFGDQNLKLRLFPHTDPLGAELRRLPPGTVTVASAGPDWTWLPPNRPRDGRMFGLFQDFDREIFQGNPEGDRLNLALGLTVLTEGDWVAGEILRRYGAGSFNVGIGVDAVFLQGPTGIPRERFRVFCPARASHLKGWDTARAVLAEVRRREPRASCVTFGTESGFRLGGVPHIHVRHPTDAHLRELYSQCGVFLLPSRHEGFGLPAAEAMACGAPVVCTDAGGNLEFCRHGETALVGRSVAELADHAVAILRDPSLAARLGSAGMAFVQKYRWDAVVDKLETLYSFGGFP